MNCCNNIIATNAGGIPRIVSNNTVIPVDATATLPVNLTLNDTTRPLTLANGTPVTAAELLNVSMFTVYNDRTRGLLILTSRTVA